MVELTAQFLARARQRLSTSCGASGIRRRDEVNPTDQLPSAISVSMTYPNLPFFFGRVLGRNTFDLQSSAIAMYQPRDIMLVLDFSGSMNDDSELKSDPHVRQTGNHGGAGGDVRRTWLTQSTANVMQVEPTVHHGARPAGRTGEQHPALQRANTGTNRSTSRPR